MLLHYKERFRESIHYVSSNMMFKNRRFLSESPSKWTTILATPFGIALYFYIKNTDKSTVLKLINLIKSYFKRKDF